MNNIDSITCRGFALPELISLRELRLISLRCSGHYRVSHKKCQALDRLLLSEYISNDILQYLIKWLG